MAGKAAKLVELQGNAILVLQNGTIYKKTVES